MRSHSDLTPIFSQSDVNNALCSRIIYVMLILIKWPMLPICVCVYCVWVCGSKLSFFSHFFNPFQSCRSWYMSVRRRNLCTNGGKYMSWLFFFFLIKYICHDLDCSYFQEYLLFCDFYNPWVWLEHIIIISFWVEIPQFGGPHSQQFNNIVFIYVTSFAIWIFLHIINCEYNLYMHIYIYIK